jgi:hypothetical protein
VLSEEAVETLRRQLNETQSKLGRASQTERRRSGMRILEHDFEDDFVRSSTFNQSKRLYFHLLHRLVSFELLPWCESQETPTLEAEADLFCDSPRAEGAILLAECRDRLLILPDFHQAAYLGALVKCYSLSSRPAFFLHIASVINSLLSLCT